MRAWVVSLLAVGGALVLYGACSASARSEGSPPVAADEAGQVDLTSNATTLTLLQANAVVRLKAAFDGQSLERIGITCALCHSTVDDSLTSGVGHRLDGWPNRDLDVGAVVSLAPDAGLQKIADLLHSGNPGGPRRPWRT